MQKFAIALLAAAAISVPAAAQDEKKVEKIEIEVEEGGDPLGALDHEDGEDVRHEVIVKEIRKDGSAGSEDKMEAKAKRMMSDCAGRVFETAAMIKTDDGEVRKTKIKLCGDSDNDDSWVETLISAKKKIATSERISDESRAAIIADIDAEISRTIADEDG